MGTLDAILPVGRLRTPSKGTVEIPPSHKEIPAPPLEYRLEN